MKVCSWVSDDKVSPTSTWNIHKVECFPDLGGGRKTKATQFMFECYRGWPKSKFEISNGYTSDTQALKTLFDLSTIDRWNKL